jgi:hypothetical protein
MTFNKWMDNLDELCGVDLHRSIHELPDIDFLDAYRGGSSPEDFAAEHRLPRIIGAQMAPRVNWYTTERTDGFGF